MQKKVPQKPKIAGSTIIDASRRHNADQGGRNPLTEYPLVPVGCVMSMELISALKVRSEMFINPTTYKPYGFTALCRIISQMMIDKIDRFYEMDYLTYLESRNPTSGRGSVGDGAKKVSLLIPKPIVERINERVMAFNNPLIGTSSVLRFLIEKGLQKLKLEDLYAYTPAKHLALMVTKRLTIKDLQTRYELESAAKRNRRP